jgi:hypothetical protein
MERDRVDIGEGLALVRGDLSGAPAEAVWPAGSLEIETGRARPNIVALIEEELAADAMLPLPEARWRLRRLVTALRLWRGGSVSLPANGWARADEGPWRQVALHPAPPARGGAWSLRAEEEDGFREFAALLALWEPSGPLGWALARFDMGCERGSDAEALSDYLLALRGLLDAMDEAGQPTLGRRLAALCAEEPDRPLLQSRVESALALELALIAGMPIDAWSPPPGVESARDLVAEIEEHLRALLRDVACGYLKPDLAAMADEILLQTAPIHVEVRDLREQALAEQASDAHEHAPPKRARGKRREPAPALVAPEAEPTVTRAAAPREPGPRATASPAPAAGHPQPSLVVDDFAWDLDDPGDYSAAV